MSNYAVVIPAINHLIDWLFAIFGGLEGVFVLFFRGIGSSFFKTRNDFCGRFTV